MTVRDDQPRVASAGLIDPRIVNFVEDAIANREPDTAEKITRAAHRTFAARRPVILRARGDRERGRS